MSLFELFAHNKMIEVPEKLHILKESEVEEFNYQEIIQAIKKDITQLVEQINLQIRSKISYKWIRLSKKRRTIIKCRSFRRKFQPSKRYDNSFFNERKRMGIEIRRRF